MARETDTTRFAQDVIEASRQQPVLVDFWAPWCGPCRTVGPVLEKLDAEAGGRWRLVKVNTDENPELADRYRITGIPAMKLFRDGEVVGELTGALPEREMRQWLEEKIPSPTRQKLSAARAARAAGRQAEAARLAEEVHAAAPGDPEAALLLAELAFPAQPERARELLEGLSSGDAGLDERIGSIRALADYAARDGGSPAGGAWKRYDEGAEALRAARFDEAAEALLDVVKSDRALDDDGARRSLVALFQFLGDDHEVTRAFRPRLASALF